jgi:uridine phosphorylase
MNLNNLLLEARGLLQHHIQLKRGDIGRYVLLPGDPGRCKKIAAHFDKPKLIAQNREYTSYSGYLLGEKVSVVSTGIGCPSTAIAMEELIRIGADTFIRVGTSGGMQPYIESGDIAIVTGAIRDEGTTLHYMPPEFPAVADLEVVLALRAGVERLKMNYHLGISQSKDSFYGEWNPDEMPVANHLKQRWKAWVDGGAICSEMEASAIFVISSIHGTRAGGAMLMMKIPDKIPTNPVEIIKLVKGFDEDRVIRVAVEGLKILIENDRKKDNGGKR